MQRFDVRIVWGVLLVLAGVLFLAQSLGIIASGWALLWAGLFAVGGATFLLVLARDSSAWWAAIPGFSLLGLSAMISMIVLAPSAGAVWGAPLFFGAAGLSFVVVYLKRRDFWWAIIPAGVLLTLVLVTLAAVFQGGTESGAALFLGLAATFVVVGLVPTPKGRMTWAFIPAGILGAMGIILALTMSSLLNYVWPVALIGGGIYILLREFVLKRG